MVGDGVVGGGGSGWSGEEGLVGVVVWWGVGGAERRRSGVRLVGGRGTPGV